MTEPKRTPFPMIQNGPAPLRDWDDDDRVMVLGPDKGVGLVPTGGLNLEAGSRGPGSVARSVAAELRDLGVPVTRFGAVDPTGTSNCNAAFRAAKDYARSIAAISTYQVASNSRYGNVKILVPAGTYLITEPEVLFDADDTVEIFGFSLEGAGAGLTKIVFRPSVASVFARNFSFGMVRVRGISFVCDKTGCRFADFDRALGRSIQDYVFEDVGWSGPWSEIFNLTGDDNNSEWKIVGCSCAHNTGPFFNVGSSGTSDQFLNFWIERQKYWSNSAPFMNLQKGGSVSVKNFDASDWGGDLSANEYLFKLGGNSHANGVTYFGMEGVNRAELKSSYARVLYSEWGSGNIKLDGFDFGSQFGIVTPSDALIVVDALSSSGPTVSLTNGTMVGWLEWRTDNAGFDRRHRVEVRNVTWLNKLRATDAVNFVGNGGNSVWGARPAIHFEDCRSGSTQEAGQAAIWDATVGGTRKMNAAAKARELWVHNANGKLPYSANTTAKQIWPIGTVIKRVRLFAPAGGTAQTTEAVWKLQTREGSPTVLATFTIPNPSAGFNEVVNVWTILNTTALADTELTSTATAEVDNGHCMIEYGP